ncbi:hypothetical protein DEA8626_03347 [Defluviimonas aquaemixtae]|uniref:IraD/Gp25-like domain-containing protein n=1 Tax=Albidovulum aquaemixtae TaxID=1542388 RepID=A0A2R8BLL3_9RHOB|nr:GPW/gp25 family protein [Defluviimonas aquaemixtae]SPH24297.1 hypothetical protein DEA8626_03347 [Defluviimonas aquaemixtae]
MAPVSAPDAALRFVHPDLDRGPEAGLVVAGDGRLALATGMLAIRQSILMLLSTTPGERVRRPDYGCDLHRLVFAPNDETTHGLAMHYVEQAVATWEPRVQVIHIDAHRDPHAEHVMQTELHYRVRRTGIEDSASFGFDLSGGGG